MTAKRESKPVTGKLPPQAIDLEKSVLGACITMRDAFLTIGDFLQPEMFYTEAHRIIFEHIQHMNLNSLPVELSTLTNALRKSGKLEYVGGVFYLMELMEGLTTSAALESNGRIIQQKHIQRSLIVLSTNTIQDCYDETLDVFEIQEQYEDQRDNLMNVVIAKRETDNAKAFDHVRSEMARKAEFHDLDVTGIPTGIGHLDRCTAGWQGSQLIILAARPAMGKTALMLKFIYESAKSGTPVAVFSLEMSTEKLVNRLISLITEIPLEFVNKPANLSDADWHRLDMMTSEIRDLPIYWDDTAYTSMMEISAKAKRMKRKYGVGMIVIDYLQLIKSKSKNNGTREQEIGEISRSSKVLAKDLNIPVIQLSQLSRKVEERADKRPMLSDLRESGSIEQDADIVMFLYRPEYYGVEKDEMGGDTAGKAEIIIAKNRDGETDTVMAGFSGKHTKFYDIDNDFGQFNSGFPNESQQNNVITLPSNDMSSHNKWDDSPEALNRSLNEDDDDLPF